jgi:uncharacterized membrane protein HdeD (DUF308 family)
MTAENLSRNWWVIVLRGVAAIIFGLAAFVWPGLTIVSLVLLFGAYALVDGLFSIYTGLTHMGDSRRWWILALEGLAGVAVGIMAFVWPTAASVALLYVIAGWAILTGILEIVAAIRLRREISNEWLLALSGVASIALGALLIMQPAIGLVTVVWTLAGYAIFFGIMLVLLGFRLRGLNGNTRPRSSGNLQPL